MVKVDKKPIMVRNTYKLELGQEEYDTILVSLARVREEDYNISLFIKDITEFSFYEKERLYSNLYNSR